jgi:hypothetical protein
MQSYFFLLWSQLLRDHDFNNSVNLILHQITMQVNLNCFGSVLSWRDFQRLSPIEADVEMFYPIVAPQGPWIE